MPGAKIVLPGVTNKQLLKWLPNTNCFLKHGFQQTGVIPTGTLHIWSTQWWQMVPQFLLSVFLNWCCTILYLLFDRGGSLSKFILHFIIGSGLPCSNSEGVQLTKKGLASISLWWDFIGTSDKEMWPNNKSYGQVADGSTRQCQLADV